MMKLWFAARRVAAMAATPGPWMWDTDDDGEVGTHYVAQTVVPERRVCSYVSWPDNDQDAQFIALCDPDTVVALLDVAEAGEQWREAWNKDFALTGEETKARRLEFFAALDRLREVAKGDV